MNVGHEQIDLRALWDFDDAEKSEQIFRNLLPQVRSNRDLMCEVLTQVARAQGLLRHFDQAKETLHEVKDLLDETTPKGRIRYFLELGRTENSSGHKPEACLHFQEAYTLATEAGEEFLAIDAAHMLGIAEEPTKALEWNERAILEAEQAADPKARAWVGSLYNNTAWTYHDMGQYPRAMELFQRALAFRTAEGDPKKINIARWCVARCKRSLGQVEEALTLQEELSREHAALGSRSGFVAEEIGECLLALGRPDEAKSHFWEAYEELAKDKWLSADRLERLKVLGGGGSS